MALLKSSNPALSDSTFEKFARGEMVTQDKTMTISGSVNKSFFMVALLSLAAGISRTFAGSVGYPIMIGGVILGLVIALVTVFKKEWSPFTAPAYAIVEGAVLGILSAFFESIYPGIVFQATLLTMGTLFLMLTIYRTGAIRVTEKFKTGVAAATGAIVLVYAATWILGFFDIGIPYIHEGGWIGIGFSLFVVVIAALNLVMDFDFIVKGEQHGLPSYMEWYGAFGLTVTLVWLYIEFLRLLAKLRD